MQKNEKVIQISKLFPSRELTKNEQVDIDNPKGWISVLFTRLMDRYPEQFAIRYPSREAERAGKKEWIDVLKNMPLIRMKIGLERCKEINSKFSQYIPTATQFLNLCRYSEKELNIPDFGTCLYFLSHRMTQKHPFLLILSKYVDLYNFFCLSMRERERTLKPFYEIACKQALREQQILPFISRKKNDGNIIHVSLSSIKETKTLEKKFREYEIADRKSVV